MSPSNHSALRYALCLHHDKPVNTVLYTGVTNHISRALEHRQRQGGVFTTTIIVCWFTTESFVPCTAIAEKSKVIALEEDCPDLHESEWLDLPEGLVIRRLAICGRFVVHDACSTQCSALCLLPVTAGLFSFLVFPELPAVIARSVATKQPHNAGTLNGKQPVRQYFQERQHKHAGV